jgi:hypothetical protein
MIEVRLNVVLLVTAGFLVTSLLAGVLQPLIGFDILHGAATSTHQSPQVPVEFRVSFRLSCKP